MRLREHDAIQDGKLDMFRADPRGIVVQDGYNVRDLTAPGEIEELRELASDIAENGVKSPLLIRFDGEQIILVEGHRRLAATLMAIEAGHDIKSVPIFQEARGVNDADRTLGLLISNSGKPLAPLEIAEVVRRLIAFGWSHEEIRKRRGWKSAGTVKNYLDMLGMPEAVKQQVRAGNISATLAGKISKNCDPDVAADLIRKNKEENARIRGKDKRHKVTAKTIKRDKDKREATNNFTPPPGEEPARHVELPPASVPIASADAADETDRAIFDEQNSTTASVVDQRPQPALAATSKSQNGTGQLLAELASIAEEACVVERPDDYIVEVPAGLLKRAWKIHSAAVGVAA